MATHTAPPRSTVDRRRAAVLAAAVGVALIVACAVWGHWLETRGFRLHLSGGQPITARWQPRLPGLAAVPVLLAVLLLARLPRWAERLPWHRLLATSALVAAGWAVALALVDGPAALAEPLTTRWEYLADVDRVGALGPFLATFTDHVLYAPGEFQWATHVSGHPPGALLVFAGLDRLGLGAPGWAAALCVGAGASAVPAVLATTRLLGGAEVARRAAPFVAAAPVALWVATSADALFLGVSAWGVCALAHGAARRDRAGDALALAGGVLLGATLFLSYGLTLVGVLAVAAVAAQRRVRPLLVGAIGVAAVAGAFAGYGFWWFDGLAVAADRVREGPVWIDRPWWYFAVANLAALAVSVGPATVAALGMARGLGRAVALPAAAAGAVLLAIASSLSRGEVERIYLPFALWLLPLAAALPGRHRRGWLAAQLAAALTVQLLWLPRW
jgi:hypothetical protein